MLNIVKEFLLQASPQWTFPVSLSRGVGKADEGRGRVDGGIGQQFIGLGEGQDRPFDAVIAPADAANNEVEVGWRRHPGRRRVQELDFDQLRNAFSAFGFKHSYAQIFEFGFGDRESRRGRKVGELSGEGNRVSVGVVAGGETGEEAGVGSVFTREVSALEDLRRS